jgi:hypothetical protein
MDNLTESISTGNITAAQEIARDYGWQERVFSIQFQVDATTRLTPGTAAGSPTSWPIAPNALDRVAAGTISAGGAAAKLPKPRYVARWS